MRTSTDRADAAVDGNGRLAAAIAAVLVAFNWIGPRLAVSGR